jgi:hypothetical protein
MWSKTYELKALLYKTHPHFLEFLLKGPTEHNDMQWCIVKVNVSLDVISTPSQQHET